MGRVKFSLWEPRVIAGDMDTKTVVISVQVKTSPSKFESVVNNRIEKVHTGSSFDIIFNDCTDKQRQQ